MLPLRFQIVNLKSPSAAGAHLLPLLCASAFGSFAGGAVNSRKNYTFYTFVFAACMILIGSGLLTTLPHGLEIPGACYGYQVILGLGIGTTFSTISVMTSLSTDSNTHAVSQGIVAQMRVLGGSIGVAASNGIYNSMAHSRLQGILTYEQISDLQTSTSILQSLKPVQAEAVRVVYADSFSQSMRVCMYIAIASLVASLATWQKNPPSVSKAHAKPETKQASAEGPLTPSSDEVDFNV